MAGNDVLHEELEQHLLLRLLEPHDLRDELRIDEEALLTRHWVYPDERVDRVDGILADEAAGQMCVIDHLG